jgi:Phage portal protein, SPP1 Gp6-like
VVSVASQSVAEVWRERLLAALAARDPYLARMDAYYRGEHSLLFATIKFRETFGSLLRSLSDNWCDLVVDASAERLRVDGFRFGSEDADQDAWAIWQRNDLDAESEMTHTEAIKLGCAYALVGPDDGGLAAIQIEPPTSAIVALDPAQGRRRLAGIRHWADEWGSEHCVLYLPDEIVWWQRESENAAWDTDELASGANKLGVVPLIPLANAPTLRLRQGRSDVERVIPLQDAVNKLCSDMLVASEFAAFPQRWATGTEIERDPETGERKADFLSGVDRMWVVPDENARMGAFPVADLTIYVRAIEMLIQHIAAQTRTPPHYLLGSSGSFPSGESLQATETGLVAKVRRKQLAFGEGWEEAIRLAFAVEGDTARAAASDVETIWANPESRQTGVIVDAAVKLASIGVPRPALWEFCGATPSQVKQWTDEGAPTEGAPVVARETVQVTPQQAGAPPVEGVTQP